MINEDSVEANKSISERKDNVIRHKINEVCKNNYESNDDTMFIIIIVLLILLINRQTTKQVIKFFI